jgi:hypothetical protein
LRLYLRLHLGVSFRIVISWNDRSSINFSRDVASGGLYHLHQRVFPPNTRGTRIKSLPKIRARPSALQLKQRRSH